MSDTVKVPLWERRAEAQVTPCAHGVVQVCVTYGRDTGGGAELTLYASPAECRALADTLRKAGDYVLHRGAVAGADAARCEAPGCFERPTSSVGELGGRSLSVCGQHGSWARGRIDREPQVADAAVDELPEVTGRPVSIASLSARVTEMERRLHDHEQEVPHGR